MGKSLLTLLALLLLSFQIAPVGGQEPLWIWSGADEAKADNAEFCFFRKKFKVTLPRQALLRIASSADYEVYVNGQLAAVGNRSNEIQTFNVGSSITAGKNTLAVKVATSPDTKQGLFLELKIQSTGSEQWQVVATDNTWRTSHEAISIWKTSVFNDSRWALARRTAEVISLGNEPATKPQTSKPAEVESAVPAQLAGTRSSKPEPKTDDRPVSINDLLPSAAKIRQQGTEIEDEDSPLKIQDEFSILRILSGDYGSYLAMEFNEFGQTIISCEGKGLILVDYNNPVGDANRVRTICDEVKNVQGILPLNGDIFVTGDGPEGAAVYRLHDEDRDGYYESVKTIARFRERIGEHGPHGIRLGPDGRLYVVIGNANGMQGEAAKSSPYRYPYEGDLLRRFEDPGGHAVGIKAPGGTIVRMNLDGSRPEIVAGGLRNAYDLVFNSEGELFIHDSDMEADIGAPWYRPTSLYHVIPGADLGWRSGWAKWPTDYVDSIPPIAETGPGSPAGAEIYEHFMFPVRYHGALFLSDWSNGRLLAVKLLPENGTYRVSTEVFLQGNGLTITDVAVGPDGGLYFCTGGRGTEGGIYRVGWDGKVPDSFAELKNELQMMVRMPQSRSAWTLQQKALLKQGMGKRWNEAVLGILGEKGNRVDYRLQAFQAMQFFGPRPDIHFLRRLTYDKEPRIRRQAARYLFQFPQDQAAPILRRLLKDSSPEVQRAVCETICRLGIVSQPSELAPLLRSSHWAVSTAARKAVELIPVESWRDRCFETKNKQEFIQLATALMAVDPSKENGKKLVQRYVEFSEQFISDENFVKFLRVVQLALHRGQVTSDQVPEATERIAQEFPSGSGRINRELAQILAYLKYAKLDGRLVSYFSEMPDEFVDQLSVALAFQEVGADLDSESRLAVLGFIEKSREREVAGSSFPYYLTEAAESLANHLTIAEYPEILKKGAAWPTATLHVLKNQKKFEPDDIQQVINIDRALSGKHGDPVRKLQLAHIAVLAQHGGKAGMEYLREAWRLDPLRRSDLVIGLAQQPDGENWPYLVSSIGQIDDDSTGLVLRQLVDIDRRPQESKYYRDVLLAGQRLRQNGGFAAAALLKNWTEHEISTESATWQSTLDQWKQWLQQKYPDVEMVDATITSQAGNWTVGRLLDALEKNDDAGDVAKGREAFVKAQCSKCHRMGRLGEIMGPDLTTLARRFSKREILDSILHPSKVVSDQYQAYRVETADGQTLTGIVSKTVYGDIKLLQDDGTKIQIPKDEVVSTSETEVSAMPEGLLDTLSQEEIADLFAFIESYKDPQRITQAPVSTERSLPIRKK